MPMAGERRTMRYRARVIDMPLSGEGAAAPAARAARAARAIAPSLRERYDRLDAWRGVAIAWMACFHFSFDLNLPEFGYLVPHQNFGADSFWSGQRFCIVSLFLLGAGASQAVALDLGQGWRRFWRRWGQVAGSALLVSAGSALMFPHSWISFGVLHGIAVMLLAVRALGSRLPPARLGRSALSSLGVFALAATCWILPHVAAHPFFDARATNWVGLVTHLPITEDYVPVLPWLGTMLAGYLAASWLLVHARHILTGPLHESLRSLAVLGRWSLVFYLLHQPILIGLVMLVHAL
ncbi:MAG TPA: heparan-alpha-glucosaminide N-acetyltransferase [Burkholderiaceae bacterium]|jgi:uncharacterized membrane protein|nr:heparan-alpha-glucosaminide N-acetyltransferase [Burkholderiaceae bacterium]